MKQFRALVRLNLLLHSFALTAFAQTTINGQTFSRGLAIINAPAINSEHNAPGTLPISIEVSGNGKLTSDAFLPGSRLPTAYEELNIFLVSSQTESNLTVTIGPQLLTDETGTVRHLNWQIPTCIRPGRYNMTFYETSRLEGQELYAITPIPITIRNNAPPGDCANIQNALENQPQSDRAAPVPPFIPGGNFEANPTVTTTIGGALPSRISGAVSNMTTVTMVIESPTVFTENGSARSTSTTFTTTATMRKEDLSVFIPVNTGRRSTAMAPLILSLAFAYFASLS